ncbi:MAG: hypothetical protein OES57_12325 [Acidimicrobiia bacterium]|nr:hypothetical protein [Acidimicrobiia bacterium]
MTPITRLRSTRAATVTEYALALGATVLLLLAGISQLEDGVTSELEDRGDSIGQPGIAATTLPTTTTVSPTTTVAGPTTTSPTGTVFISLLASTSNWSGSKWVATVEVTIQDAGGNPVVGAEIEAEWSEPFVSETSCVTDSSSTCSMTQWNLNSSRDSTTWSVVNISAPPLTYDPALNVVSDITVNKP